MSTTAKPRRYECGLCGRESPAAEMVFSRYTGSRYCLDTAACKKRSARRKRQAAAS